MYGIGGRTFAILNGEPLRKWIASSTGGVASGS